MWKIRFVMEKKAWRGYLELIKHMLNSNSVLFFIQSRMKLELKWTSLSAELVSVTT